MDKTFITIIQKIITEYRESILSEPRRVSALFADLAQDIPKPQKNAFLKCLEHGFVQVLKNTEESERENCKQRLVQKLHNEEGLDLGLCGETLDLLESVLFGEVKNETQSDAKKKVISNAASSELSSGSGGRGYGIGVISPIPNSGQQPVMPVQNVGKRVKNNSAWYKAFAVFGGVFAIFIWDVVFNSEGIFNLISNLLPMQLFMIIILFMFPIFGIITIVKSIRKKGPQKSVLYKMFPIVGIGAFCYSLLVASEVLFEVISDEIVQFLFLVILLLWVAIAIVLSKKEKNAKQST